jgi:hypothetical protein
MTRFTTAAAVLAVMAVAACSSEATNADYSGGSERPTSGGVEGSSGATGGSSTAPSGSSSGSTSSTDSANGTTNDVGQVQAGLLTAGVWDDNLNFDFYQKYVGLTGDPRAKSLPAFSDADRTAAQAKFAQRGAKQELDIAFMLDTTGSMGDELAYIHAEIDGIASAIKASHAQITPRYGLVVYRDFVDIYQTRSFDFDTVENFKANLAQQSADGGGDYPEDVADGMAATLQLKWRTDPNVARMVVWVADAPPHYGAEGSVHDSIVKAAGADIHFYPVAASGADDRTEFTMRATAQITGGRYLFLTDDSGIGDSHEEPHIPCYVVTKFDGALERMVESELTGTHIDPATSDIIRTVGNPTNDVCATSKGNVTLY